MSDRQVEMGAQPGPKPKGGCWWAIVLFGGFFLLMALFVLYLKGGGNVPGSQNATSQPTPAEMLASIDGRDRHDPEVQATFTRLDAVCPEDGIQVADIVTKTQSLFKQETGTAPGLIPLMTSLADLGEQGQGTVNCAELAASYYTLMTK